MSFLRPTTTFARFTRLTAPRSIHPRTIRPLSSTTSHRAQGYGDATTNNSKQDTSSAQSAGEHPGPDSPASASAESGGSRSKEAAETGSSPTGGQVGNSGVKSSYGAQPKISDKNEPGTDDKEYAKEVEEHNREFEKRHDRAKEAEDDKVDEKFWEGQGGHKET